MTNTLKDKTAEEKQQYVNAKVAYWPKSILGRFSEMEQKVNESTDKQQAMFDMLSELDNKMNEILSKKVK